MVMDPDRVWAREGCASRRLPFLRLDLSEVTPAMVKPGGLLNYRFPYTACVPAQPGYILGRLRTRAVQFSFTLTGKPARDAG